MKQRKLNELSLPELIKRRKTLKTVLNTLMILGAVLFLVVVVEFYKKGSTPLIIILLSQIPIIILSRNNLNAIETEIESR